MEKFAREVAKGESFSDAYRLSYNTKNYTEKTIHEASSRMMKDCKVSARVNDLREKLRVKAEEDFTVSKAELMKKVWEWVDMPDKQSTGVAAAALISKMLVMTRPQKLNII